MIPKLLHHFGDEASKWFTGSGLLVYKDMKWNPEKGTASSAKERDSVEMVKEDLWDLTSKLGTNQREQGFYTPRQSRP
jgi:hypothetical protein